MDTMQQLEKAVEEIVKRYQDLLQKVQTLEKQLEDSGKEAEQKWLKEKDEITDRINSMINIIESSGITLNSES